MEREQLEQLDIDVQPALNVHIFLTGKTIGSFGGGVKRSKGAYVWVDVDCAMIYIRGQHTEPWGVSLDAVEQIYVINEDGRGGSRVSWRRPNPEDLMVRHPSI